MTITVQSNERPIETTPAAAKAAPEGAIDTPKDTPSAPVENAEQKEATESGTEATEEEKESDTETADPKEEGSETEAKDGDKDEKTPKKKSGFQKRIDKLSARTAAAQQEAEYWKREALKNATESKADPKENAAKPADATEGKPKPDQFETHAEFVEALTDWKTDQKLKERDQVEQRKRLETEQAKRGETYSQRVEAFRAKTPDFQDVEDTLTDALMSARLRPSPAMVDVFTSSENGVELAYELAKDPDEFMRVCKLQPGAAYREIGKLESRLASRSSPEQKKTEPKKTTQAPAPLETVKAGGKGSATKSIYDPNLSQREYETIRAKERAKRSG